MPPKLRRAKISISAKSFVVLESEARKRGVAVAALTTELIEMAIAATQPVLQKPGRAE